MRWISCAGTSRHDPVRRKQEIYRCYLMVLRRNGAGRVPVPGALFPHFSRPPCRQHLFRLYVDGTGVTLLPPGGVDSRPAIYGGKRKFPGKILPGGKLFWKNFRNPE